MHYMHGTNKYVLMIMSVAFSELCIVMYIYIYIYIYIYMLFCLGPLA